MQLFALSFLYDVLNNSFYGTNLYSKNGFLMFFNDKKFFYSSVCNDGFNTERPYRATLKNVKKLPTKATYCYNSS